MKCYWCKCTRCNGGKVVRKSTWYVHNPGWACKGVSFRPGRSSPSPQRNSPPYTGSRSTDIDMAEPLGDPNPPGNADQTSLSDLVSVVSFLSYLIYSVR